MPTRLVLKLHASIFENFAVSAVPGSQVLERIERAVDFRQLRARKRVFDDQIPAQLQRKRAVQTVSETQSHVGSWWTSARPFQAALFWVVARTAEVAS
jgi:hypothetical protein